MKKILQETLILPIVSFRFVSTDLDCFSYTSKYAVFDIVAKQLEWKPCFG
jgi:hypothetical protein